MDNPLYATTLEDIVNIFSKTEIKVTREHVNIISNQLKIIHYLDVTKSSFESPGDTTKEIEITVNEDPRPIINFSAFLVNEKTKVPTSHHLPSLYLTESNQIHDNVIGILDIIQDYYKPKLEKLKNIKVPKLELQNTTKENGILNGNYKIKNEEMSIEEFIDYMDKGIRNNLSKPGEVSKYYAEAVNSILRHDDEDIGNLLKINSLYEMIYTTINKLFYIDTKIRKKQPEVLELAPNDILYHDLEEIHKYTFSDIKNINRVFIALEKNKTKVSLPLWCT